MRDARVGPQDQSTRWSKSRSSEQSGPLLFDLGAHEWEHGLQPLFAALHGGAVGLALAVEGGEILHRVDGHHLVPAIHQSAVLIEQLVEQSRPVIQDAGLKRKLGILPDDVERIELDAADALEKFEDAGFAIPGARRPEALVAEDEALGL